MGADLPSADEGTSRDKPVEVPYTLLTSDALKGVVEEFVTRHGTDYGLHEKTLEEKVSDVMRQLQRGEAKIVFDPGSQTTNIVVSK